MEEYKKKSKKQKAIERIRTKVLKAEQERLRNANTISVSEARSMLRDRVRKISSY